MKYIAIAAALLAALLVLLTIGFTAGLGVMHLVHGGKAEAAPELVEAPLATLSDFLPAETVEVEVQKEEGPTAAEIQAWQAWKDAQLAKEIEAVGVYRTDSIGPETLAQPEPTLEEELSAWTTELAQLSCRDFEKKAQRRQCREYQRELKEMGL